MGTILLDTETLVGKLAELLAARAEDEGIAAAWLFGSVARDGKLLLGQDSLRRVDFEVRSRNEFWDLEPYLRLCRGQEPR